MLLIGNKGEMIEYTKSVSESYFFCWTASLLETLGSHVQNKFAANVVEQNIYLKKCK